MLRNNLNEFFSLPAGRDRFLIFLFKSNKKVLNSEGDYTN